MAEPGSAGAVQADRDLINKLFVLVDHEDTEAQWVVWAKNDGVELIRPCQRLFVPYELLPALTDAMRTAWGNWNALSVPGKAIDRP
jgi:hypothetical protein